MVVKFWTRIDSSCKIGLTKVGRKCREEPRTAWNRRSLENYCKTFWTLVLHYVPLAILAKSKIIHGTYIIFIKCIVKKYTKKIETQMTVDKAFWQRITNWGFIQTKMILRYHDIFAQDPVKYFLFSKGYSIANLLQVRA